MSWNSEFLRIQTIYKKNYTWRFISCPKSVQLEIASLLLIMNFKRKITIWRLYFNRKTRFCVVLVYHVLFSKHSRRSRFPLKLVNFGTFTLVMNKVVGFIICRVLIGFIHDPEDIVIWIENHVFIHLFTRPNI